MAVDGGGVDRHVRMGRAEPLDAFGRGEQTEETEIVGAALLQLLDRGDGGIGRAGAEAGDGLLKPSVTRRSWTPAFFIRLRCATC